MVEVAGLEMRQCEGVEGYVRGEGIAGGRLRRPEDFERHVRSIREG